jgi:hypothetical protein
VLTSAFFSPNAMAHPPSSFLSILLRSIVGMLVIVFLTGAAASAPVTVDQYNFSVEIPEGWTPLETPTPEIALARESADKQKTVRVGVLKVQTDELVAGTRDMVEGMKQGMLRSGLRIENERDAAMAGLFFHTLVARGAGTKTAAGYTTSAGDCVYGIQLHSNQTDASSDPELQAIIASFRLLAPKHAGETPAFRIGYQVGQNLLMFGLFGAVLVLGVGAWLIIRKKKPRKRRRSHRHAAT